MIPSDMAGDPTASDFAFNRWTVLYDADCGFCRWSLAQLLALDREGRLRPVALSSPEADAMLADLPAPARAASWHLVGPDGSRFSGGAAGAPLLRLLPGGSLPASVLAAAPGVTESAYRWIAGHRSHLSRLVPSSAKRRATARIAARASR
jgi:predicted DCC family thiol-disulfide oxidoreductase YuxK